MVLRPLRAPQGFCDWILGLSRSLLGSILHFSVANPEAALDSPKTSWMTHCCKMLPGDSPLRTPDAMAEDKMAALVTS